MGRYADRASPPLVAPVPRPRLTFARELALAALPVATVVAIFALVDAFTRQRLLFTSLASSAFLIYLEPNHGANEARTLVTAQMSAALAGFAGFAWFGPGYAAGAVALTATILVMIAARAMHPPAVSTALSFAFRTGNAGNLALFLLAVGLTTVLVALQRAAQWLLRRLSASGGG